MPFNRFLPSIKSFLESFIKATQLLNSDETFFNYLGINLAIFFKYTKYRFSPFASFAFKVAFANLYLTTKFTCFLFSPAIKICTIFLQNALEQPKIKINLARFIFITLFKCHKSQI